MQNDLICYVYGIGAWGPGFASWEELQARFVDPAGIPLELPVLPAKAEVIPGNERRRAPPVVRAAVEVSAQATRQAQIEPAELACVFGSGLGDTETTDYLCTQLATQEKQLSPTRFHNSVHNAAAGYWTIATQCMRSANSIAAYNHTAGVSLLEAVAQAGQEQVPVLVTLFDLAARGIYEHVFAADLDFAAALVLSPVVRAHPPLAKMAFSVATESPRTPAWAESFTQLHSRNPAARVLPLLHALASPAPAMLVGLELGEGSFLQILVEKLGGSL